MTTQMILSLFNWTKACAKVEGSSSEWFEVEPCVQQTTSSTSQRLFNLALRNIPSVSDNSFYKAELQQSVDF